MTATQSVSYRHRLTAVGLLFAVLIGIYWFIDGVLIAKYRFYQTNIEELQTRLQIFDNMLATRDELTAKIQQVRQDQSFKTHLLQQVSPTLAATDLQQRVKRVVESSGGELVSTQILPVTEEGGFSRVAINISLTGDMEVIQKMLYDLESKTPLLFVNNLQVTARTLRRRRYSRRNRNTPVETTVQLTVQFELAGYMRRSMG